MTRTHALRASLGILAVLALCSCGTGSPAGTDGAAPATAVAVDGSSTVLPMSKAAHELFAEESPGDHVVVASSGTGGGFVRFCAGETDISDASRPIDPADEAPVCQANGVEYAELQVAVDALTVVVHPDLAVDCLTTEQLVELWRPGSPVTRWSDLDPRFPDQRVALFGPGTDSGTYDYLAGDVIDDVSGATREDYEASEDDRVLVQGVAGTPGATGYFGYSYYEEYADSLKALAIDDGDGCVAPSARTAQAGTYTPLSRPLFIYVNTRAYREKDAVRRYTDYYIENLGTIAAAAQFIPLHAEQYAETRNVLAGLSE